MKFENENWVLNIEQDENPLNPRSLDYTDCNIAKMVCFHRRYDLGDKHDYDFNNYDSWAELKKAICKNENVVAILPLFMYDHSGITISTSPFSCRWDSGQIGFVYVTKEMLFEHVEVGRKRISKNSVKKALQNIACEVETYKQYLEGDVYFFEATDKHNNDTDSCYGFYGSNIWENGISDNVQHDCIVDLYPLLKAEFGENKAIKEIIEKVLA